MKINKKTKIIGEKVILVPYRKSHVLKYHEWMKSADLLELTCSEPLSLEEEYDMQIKWMEDEDKCTFIILDKAAYDVTKDEIEPMIGDTNIFIMEKENNDGNSIGEIEIMIAEKSARGKKLGWEAVILMMLYGIKHLSLNSYQAKILLKNIISIKMFEKLGFEKSSTSTIFEEVTMVKHVTDDWVEWLEQQYKLQTEEC